MNIATSYDEVAAKMRGWHQSGSLQDVPKVHLPAFYAEELESHSARLDIFERMDNSRYDLDGRPGRFHVPDFLAPQQWVGPTAAQWTGKPDNGELLESYADGFSVTRSDESGVRSLDYFHTSEEDLRDAGVGVNCRFVDRLQPENNFEQEVYFFSNRP